MSRTLTKSPSADGGATRSHSDESPTVPDHDTSKVRRPGIRWFPTIVFTITTAAFLFLPLTGQRTFAPVDMLELGSPYRDAIQRPPDVASPIQGDIIEDHIPSQVSFFEALGEGRYQLWQPLTAAGIPRGVWPTSFGYLSPFNIAYLVAPDWYATGLRTALVFLVAQVFMYLFLRRLGTGVVAATLGGIAYAFAGTNLVFMLRITAPMLLPAMLWATDRLVSKPGFRRLLPLSLLVAWAWFEGFPFAFFMTLAVAALWGVWAACRKDGSEPAGNAVRARRTAVATAWLAGAMAAGVLLGAVQFLPFAQDIRQRGILENRQYTSDTHLPTLQYLGLVDERLLGRSQLDYWSGGNPYESSSQSGALVLFAVLAGLAAAAAGRLRLTERQRAAWSMFGVMTAVVALMTWVGTPLLGIFYKLPMLGNNPFVRGRFVVNLGLVVLAAISLDALMARARSLAPVEPRAHRPSRVVSGIVLAALAGIGAMAIVPWYRAADRAGDLTASAWALALALLSIVVASGLVWAVMRTSNGVLARLVVCVLAGIVFVQLVFRFTSFVPAAPKADFYTRQRGHDALAGILGDRYRMTGSDLQTFAPGANIVLGLPDLRGTALRSDDFATVLEAIDPSVYSRDPLKPILDGPNWHLESPLLDDLAVRAYALGTMETPLGVVSTVDDGWDTWTRGTQARLSPLPPAPGAIQGVLIPLRADGKCKNGSVRLRISRGDQLLDVSERPSYDMNGNWLAFGVVGDGVRPGERLDVAAESTEPGCSVEIGTVMEENGTERPATQWILPVEGQTYRLAETEQGWIYERPTAWPFVSAHSRWRAFSDQESLLAYAGSRPIAERDVASYVVPSPESEPTPPAGAADSLVRDVETDGNSWSFGIEGDSPNLVVVSENTDHGWHAEIDGEPVDTVAVDGALIGLFVPEGSHRVTLGYMPTSFLVGAAISGVTLVFLIVAVGIETVGERRSRRRDAEAREPAGPSGIENPGDIRT